MKLIHQEKKRIRAIKRRKLISKKESMQKIIEYQTIKKKQLNNVAQERQRCMDLMDQRIECEGREINELRVREKDLVHKLRALHELQVQHREAMNSLLSIK
jgi:hypothetical protein